MTNEEAIEIIKQDIPCEHDTDLIEALDVAIKALEQQPCDDAISRHAVLEKAINVPIAQIVTEDKVICRKIVFVDDIENMPPVTPQPKTGHWIETAEEYYKAVNEYGGGVNEDTPYFVDDIACSVCLAKYSVIDNETERFDCCPSCGVKLVEPQERSDKE